MRASPTPAPNTPRLGRVRLSLVVAAASVVVLLVEFAGTRFGRDAIDPLRMTVAFGLILVAATLHGIFLRRAVIEYTADLRNGLEHELTVAKDTFIANVSHGLRTPLTGVVGFAHLLRDTPAGAQEREAVDMIVAESAEMSRMVDDLVTAAQIDSDALTISVRPTPILDQVEKVCDFMELFGAEVGIDIQDVDVMIDPEHFMQVLRNLVANAHRHGKTPITVRGTVANGRYVCHVIDQGPGVSPVDQSRLFTRFASSVFGSQFTGSVGLGLSVVAELTARMGCEVSYRRIRGETQFVLAIPLAEEQTRPMNRIVRSPSTRRDVNVSPHLQVVSA